MSREALPGMSVVPFEWGDQRNRTDRSPEHAEPLAAFPSRMEVPEPPPQATASRQGGSPMSRDDMWDEV